MEVKEKQCSHSKIWGGRKCFSPSWIGKVVRRQCFYNKFNIYLKALLTFCSPSCVNYYRNFNFFINNLLLFLSYLGFWWFKTDVKQMALNVLFSISAIQISLSMSDKRSLHWRNIWPLVTDSCAWKHQTHSVSPSFLTSGQCLAMSGRSLVCSLSPRV